MTGAAPSLLSVLDLREMEGSPDRFIVGSHWTPHGLSYGGQMVGQSAAAALRTVPDDRHAHSMHGYFLRAGDASKPIEYQVERLQDGRSISHRRVQAYQDGALIWSTIVTLKNALEGPSHQSEMPDVPGPEEIQRTPLFGSTTQATADDEAFEMRRFTADDLDRVGGQDVGRIAMWIRGQGDLPDDPGFHASALAYASDFGPLFSVLRRHGISSGPDIRITSIDHAVWWHVPARVDQWLLYVVESPRSGGGGGLSLGRFFTQDGTLVASTAQEGIARGPKPVS